MGIASLVPSATEALFALGLGERVVGVTHECDFPPEAASRPRLTRSVIPDGMGARDVDARVRELVGAGEALYELDEATLAELDPDLIVTQAVCEVCAVSYEDVSAVARRLPSRPAVLSLDPSRLAEVLADLEPLAAAAGERVAGIELRTSLEARLDRVRKAVDDRRRTRVASLEWLDPPYVAGHWVPEMVEAAGGLEVVGAAGTRSRVAGWEEIAASRPEVVVVMPCGLDARAAAAEAERHRDELAALGAERVIAVDAAASFSRPGPRLVDGVELLAHLLHPDAIGEPRAVAWREAA
ncbi:MAG TPA: ABC transporter substrate-binding protein [Candidatus Limnocylindria bacterium]|nr:ABC transporter substrate-binding protein [Candidatus Limnocylindria bacterium]